MAANEEYVDGNEEIIELYRNNIRKLYAEREKYNYGEEMYETITNYISITTAQLRDAEEAQSNRAQGEYARRNKNNTIFQTVGSIVGPVLANTITALINRKNVKTVVGIENSGELVNSKAIKFVK